MTWTATASSSPAAPACWCWRSSSTPRRAARRSTPRSPATARPPTATTWWRRRARARCAACGWRSTTVKAPVDYINPHATSTPIGDLKEIEAIREVFGDKCPPISATKSLTGHSLGAAGVQEAIYSLLMMNNGFICESANIDDARSGVRRHADRARAASTTSSSAACCRTRSASAAPTPRWCSSGSMSRLEVHSILREKERQSGESGRHDAVDAGQARADHGGRQRPLDRLGHCPHARRAGRELAFTYQGEALGRRVKPLAESVGSSLAAAVRRRGRRLGRCACSRRSRRNGASLDFLVHAIAFSDKNELKGRYADTTRDNFVRTMVISCFSFTEVAKRAADVDAGRRRDGHADLQRRRARHAELQCDGRRQGGAGSVGALSRGRFRAVRTSASTPSRPGRSARSRAPASAMRARCSPSSSGIRRCAAA